MAAADQQVVQGFDVQVFVVGPSGPLLTGKYQSAELTLTSDTEEYLETEEQIARLLDGEFTIEGTLQRGWQHVDILRRVMGLTEVRRGIRIVLPRFSVIMRLNAPEKGFRGAGIELLDCKIQGLSLAVAAGKGVVRKDLRFRAEGIRQL
jgi:hypothetical protein